MKNGNKRKQNNPVTLPTGTQFVTIPQTNGIDNQQSKWLRNQKLCKHYQKLSTDNTKHNIKPPSGDLGVLSLSFCFLLSTFGFHSYADFQDIQSKRKHIGQNPQGAQQ